MAGKRKRTSSDNAASAGDNTEMEDAPVAVLSECPFKIEYKSPAIKKAIVKRLSKLPQSARSPLLHLGSAAKTGTRSDGTRGYTYNCFHHQSEEAMGYFEEVSTFRWWVEQFPFIQEPMTFLSSSFTFFFLACHSLFSSGWW